jgi:hypothetical protein
VILVYRALLPLKFRAALNVAGPRLNSRLLARTATDGLAT